MIRDPQGAALYIMAPANAGISTAFARGKPGHAGWNELRTTDAPAAFAFYSAHFGWGKSGEMDMGPMGPYILFNTGAEQTGGIMRSPNFPHPMWLAYFTVDDIDAAAARLQTAGGSLVWGPQEVPGGDHVLHGRDPQGALFALLGPKHA